MKRIVSLYHVILFVSSIGISISSEAALVGHWALNESSGLMASDSSGFNHPGTLTNMSGSEWSPGIISNALTFDGTNDVVTIPDHADFDLLNTMTAAAWIRISALPSGANVRTIFSKDENFSLRVGSNGALRWQWRNSSGTTRNLNSPANRISVNQWMHVAIRYTLGRQNLFINGVSVANSSRNENMFVNNDPVFIGQDLGFPARTFIGSLDEVRIYNTALTNAQIAALANLTSSLTISSALSASTCTGLAVTIAANDSSNNLVTSYTGTITLRTSTNRGTWSRQSANGNLTAGNDNGRGTYRFVSSDMGDAVLLLTNVHADDLTIRVRDAANNLTTTSPTISFRENVFVISSTDALGADVVAGRNHSFKVELWQRDATTGNCRVASQYRGNKNLKVWLTRDALDPGATAPTVGALTLPNTTPGNNNLRNARFTNGVYNFSLSTTNVGKYVLNFRDDSRGFLNRTIDGASSSYVARPFGFAIDFSGDRATNGTSGTSYATSTSGPAFTRAGQNFSTTLRAVQWQSADDANGDGVPDSGANLYNNTTTTAFNANTVLTAALVAPAGGALGTITGSPVTGFSGGARTTTLSYSEVGIIHLSASSNNYLSGGGNISGSALNLGRFYPDHFSLSAATVLPFCTAATDFSYMYQPFTATFTLIARNVSDVTTTNYQGSFAKLDTTSNAQMRYVAADTSSVPATSLSPRLTVNSSTGSWNNGDANINASLTLARINGVNGGTSVDGPYENFQPGVAPQDSDGVMLTSIDLDSDGNASNDAQSLGTMAMRYGRYMLNNAVGTELAALPVPTRLEYYSGSTNGFVTHSDDLCSSFTIPNFTLSNWGGNLSSGETVLSSVLSLTAPGVGNHGAVDVTGNGLPAWLRYDWNTATAGDEAPTARAVFGVYQGNAPLLYRRESYR